MSHTISPARVAANRRNAQRSTGPRSAEGKAKSAFNGLVHGLRAQTVVLPGEDAHAFEELRRELAEEHLPETVTEQRLLDTMAAAHWALDRARRQETAVLTRRFNEAAAQFDARQAQPAKPAVVHFKDEYAVAALKARQTSEGRKRLLDRWRYLRNQLELEWHSKDKDEMLEMLGHRIGELLEGQPLVEEITLCWIATYNTHGTPPSRHPIGRELYRASECVLKGIEQEKEINRLFPRLPTAEAGKARLIALIDDQVAQLESIVDAPPPPAAPVPVPIHTPEREAACAIALFDSSPEGALRLRYMTAQENAYSRALRNLLALRKQRWAEPDPEDDPEPTVAAPVPSEATPDAPVPSEPTEERSKTDQKPLAAVPEPPIAPRETPLDPPRRTRRG